MSNSRTPLGKRFLSVLLVLVMVIGMLPTIAFAAGPTTYEKKTTLTDGKKYLIVAESASKAYALNLSGSTLSAVEVTVEEGKISSTTATAWTASQSGDDWQFKSGDNYLGVSKTSDYTLVANTSPSGDDLKNAWAMSTTADNYNRLKTTFGSSSSAAYRSLEFNEGSWSVGQGYDDKSKISFYEEAEQANVLVGVKTDGDNLLVTKATADSTVPTATAAPVTPTGTVWDAANTAFGSTRNILGIWNVALTYGTFEMMTVKQDADVTIDLTNITGVQVGDKVHVAHWNGTRFDGLVEKIVEAGPSVTIATKDNNPFIVIGDHTLIGTDATGQKVWHNGANPTLTVTSDDVNIDNLQGGTDTQKAWTAANDNSTQPWNKAALTVLDIFDVVVTYGSTVMKELETPVLVTLNVPGVHKNDTVMVAHWNGASFDTPIQAKAPSDNTVTFKADKFSPFVVIGGASYNTITIINTTPGCTITGEGMVMNSTDYTFTVTVNSGYDASNLVVTANGNVFTVGGTKYVKNTDGTYTIKAVDDNYTISAIISKTPVVTHTVTFLPGAADAYIPFYPTTVSVAAGDDYAIPTDIPTREGYTFAGWKAGSTTYAAGATIPASAITDNVTLNAQWAAEMVNITHTDLTTVDGVNYVSAPAASVVKGSTVYFTIQLDDGYDPSTLKVTANTVPLAAVRENGTNKYYYTFTADADTTIAITAPTKYQYTVTLPAGDHFTAVFDSTADSATVDKVEHGSKSAKFTVTAAADWTVDAVYANGVKLTADSTGVYQVKNVTANTVVTISMKETVWRTVTYFLDDAGVYAQVQVQDGTTSYSTLDVPTVEGYTVTGWYDNPNYTGSPATTVASVTKDLSLYAKKEAKTFDITFNMNAGTDTTTPASIDKVVKTYGQAAQLPSTVPTRTGYTFLGWGLASTDKVAAYAPGATFSAEITGNKELFAIWQTNTFTVTLPSGTGYSISTTQSTTVEYNKDFTFTVKVDRNYSTAAPVVKWTKADGTGGADAVLKTVTDPETNPVVNTDGSKSYTYTMPGITEDRVVSVSVTENATYTVTFYTWKNDVTTTEVYQTQQVEDTYKATQPAAPVIEGYTFGGWYTVTTGTSFVLGTGSTPNSELDAAYDFNSAVKGDLVVVAQMIPITPKVSWTAGGTGWTLTVTSATPTGTYTSPYFVTYNTDVTFTVTIADGYDASNMQVGANGVALAPTKIDGNVYTYKLTGVKVNTTITVVGVVRKTVTITYNANARDDVSDMPVQQVVKYYLASDYDTITNQIPVRTGYTFLGWAKADANGTIPTAPAYSNPAKTAAADGYETSKVADFTSDTTLYAIWEAKATTILLTIEGDYYNGNGTHIDQYEGNEVTLVAKITTPDNGKVQGDVTFWRETVRGTKQKLGTSSVVNNEAILENVKVGNFENETDANKFGTQVDYLETYWVEFTPTTDEGYTVNTYPELEVLRVWSKAIAWNADNKLSITGTLVDGKMVAGNTYTLKIPAVKAYNAPATDVPKAGTDYEVIWEVKNDQNGWDTVAVSQTDSYVITEYKAGQVFRARVEAKGSIFDKEIEYVDDAAPILTVKLDTAVGKVDFNLYDDFLYTKETEKTVVQPTTTDLAITGAANEGGDVVINGDDTVFSGIGAHKAQFEGQKVTLEATVKETSTGTPAVASGSVEFYQNGTLIATVPVETAGTNMGKASCTATMKAFSGTATTAKDTFYAKYVENATYDESTSATSDVYIKSTAIKTPVIDSEKAGKLNNSTSTASNSTTYEYNLTDLLAGVKHTFTLRTGNAAADWSVVALDGRTVASTDYDIVWNVKTGDNTVTDATVGGTFVTTDNKVGDEISVTLIAKNDMKVDATSKKAIIGTKQDVNVTVTASDKIASTSATDAYQLDEVTLTATVAAAQGANATVKPSGTVTFYYSVDSGSTWTKVGATTDLVEKAGVMTASIKTTELPVTDGTNVKQTVKVTAIYHGDSTFNNSGTYTESSKTIADNANAGLTNAKADITIYSSVVYVNSTVENKPLTCSDSHTNGIYISVIDGALNANETNVTLKLSDVYTLDHADPLSKLAFGTDYSVQWQKLSNAAAYTDYAAATVPWANIDGKTNTTCDLVVEQGAAYRAVITVDPENDINRGSYKMVEQDIDGRQVYYSNVLVADKGDLDLTVTINTNKTDKGFEGIVEGETVTINTFASGATNTTPISELTATVTKLGETEPAFEQVKTDVNGYTSFDWTTTAPGYYTLKVTAVPSNGYATETVTRTLIVRDNDYSFTVSGDNTTYNGKAQGLTVTVNDDMGIEKGLAQNSVVVYYYSDPGRTQMVEPSDAGTYYATIRLQESAYWTEKTEDVTFTITKRPVSVVDLVAQAKVYDGTTAANLQEIVLNDAAVNAAGVPTDNTGVLNGDSIYATGTGMTSSAAAGTVTLTVTGAALKGDDKDNYTLDGTYAGEAFVIQRNQLKGDIADATYAYTGSSITVPADDIAVIDQQGNNFTDYTVTYYYHNGDGVEKVGAMKALGMYTVVVTPRDTDNYKGGAAQKVYVAAAAVDAAPASLTSLTLDITNTVVTYTGTPVGVTVKDSQGNTVTNVTYNGSTTVPTDAGRYLVKATASTGDTAYGLYTIVKADPALSLSASDADYNSALQTGSPVLTGAPSDAKVYYTWTGGTIQGVSYTAPTEVGKYVVTAHVNETTNYTAHEVSDTYEIKPVTLTIKADSYQRHQYGEYPQMTATFSGLATGGVAPDTSLRDVQIQPEFIFSGNNDALDQAGNYIVTPVSALARNYTVEYVDGLFTVNQVDGNPELAICGMISNGDGDKTIAYYGDAIQLYAYGSQKGIINNSSIWKWTVESGDANITPEGLLTFNKGNQDVTVRLTRGTGTQSIYTEITIHVLKQEVKVIVPELDVTYSAGSQDYTTSKTLQAVNAKGEQVFADNSKFTIGSNTRTDIGTQVVTGQVAGSIYSYQSETYGGRFTVNDKDVTVTPDAQSVVYGTDLSIVETAFTVTGEFSSVKALTDTNVASVRELYNNLDVANEYEILVTGTENINYNVKYVTAPTAPQVTVNALGLTVSTGTLDANVGMTSDSQNPLGDYPVNGEEVDSTATLGASNVRMYGEPNWVMDYALATLVDGDSLADLVALGSNLVDFNYTIVANANVKYEDKTTKIESSMTDYNVDTDASMIAFGNYTENYSEGTQNIYQRPVTLALSNGQTTLDIYYSEILRSGGTIDTAKLLNIIINNVEAGKYNDGTNYVGGLAELLKHTVKDLNLQVAVTGYTGTPSTPDYQFTAKVTVGNPNYWLGNAGQKFDITVNILLQRLTVDYTTFTATFSDVVLYQQSETTRTPAYATGDVTFIIYRYVDSQENYSYYAANETAVVSKVMTKDTSRTGRYYVTYPKLSAGTYRVFAVASGYTIID